MLIAVHRQLHRWRGRLALLWALLALCAVIAAMHLPASSTQETGGEHHMGGAALCLAVLAATGLIGVGLLTRPRRLGRPARRLGCLIAGVRSNTVLPPPIRAGPFALQVLRL